MSTELVNACVAIMSRQSIVSMKRTSIYEAIITKPIKVRAPTFKNIIKQM